MRPSPWLCRDMSLLGGWEVEWTAPFSKGGKQPQTGNMICPAEQSWGFQVSLFLRCQACFKSCSSFLVGSLLVALVSERLTWKLHRGALFPIHQHSPSWAFHTGVSSVAEGWAGCLWGPVVCEGMWVTP